MIVNGGCVECEHLVKLYLKLMFLPSQLEDPNLEGQIVLEVDPDGEIITYEINIAPYEAPPSPVPEFGISVAIVTSLATMIYLAIRKRIGKKLE